MIRHHLLPILAAAALAAADPPPQAPAPPDDGAQPAPQPRRAGARVARVAAPAAAWQARLRLSAGWDSNAILDSRPDEVRAATAVYGSDGEIAWRPAADERTQLRTHLAVAHERRPHLEGLDTTRLGVGASGAWRGEAATYGGSLAAARHWLDGEGAAAELRGGASLAWLRAASADILAAEAGLVRFDGGDGGDAASFGPPEGRSGAIAALSWRHWMLFGETTRVEAAVRGGRFTARDRVESHLMLQPWLGIRLRPDGWDAGVRAALELRRHAAERRAGDGPEASATLVIDASADRRLAAGWWLGTVAGWSARDSDAVDRDYRRWQAGLRLTRQFAAEE